LSTCLFTSAAVDSGAKAGQHACAARFGLNPRGQAKGAVQLMADRDGWGLVSISHTLVSTRKYSLCTFGSSSVTEAQARTSNGTPTHPSKWAPNSNSSQEPLILRRVHHTRKSGPTHTTIMTPTISIRRTVK